MLFQVFSKRIAHLLTKRGFKIVKTGINNKQPQYYTYFFEDTEALRAAFQEIVEANIQ